MALRCAALLLTAAGAKQLTGANVMHLHSRLGRLMRSSSLQPFRCHTRMQPREQVANTSPYWSGKARLLILSEWAVCTVCSSNLQASAATYCAQGPTSSRARQSLAHIVRCWLSLTPAVSPACFGTPRKGGASMEMHRSHTCPTVDPWKQRLPAAQLAALEFAL